MFAHVRAAYPGMPVSEQNVRPTLADVHDIFAQLIHSKA